MKKSAVAILGLGLLFANAYADDLATQSSTQSFTEGQTQMSASDAKNKMEGDAFLAANKNKPGVVTLPDGLQYKVITPGIGEKPTESDSVTVNYVGTLIDGTEFDSSYKRGQPATFPVGGVIRGWVEALKMMSTGSTWELYIPAALAYGERGAPPSIGSNQTLIFKVNLIDIKKP
jgi:FKBP-type peptidyl-prolyl cis-trans isomerase FklB